MSSYKTANKMIWDKKGDEEKKLFSLYVTGEVKASITPKQLQQLCFNEFSLDDIRKAANRVSKAAVRFINKKKSAEGIELEAPQARAELVRK